MKLGAKELRPVPLPAAPGQPGRVRLELCAFGAVLASEDAPAHLVRLLAGELLAACDQAEASSSRPAP